jgi:hypothetical protein
MVVKDGLSLLTQVLVAHINADGIQRVFPPPLGTGGVARVRRVFLRVRHAHARGCERGGHAPMANASVVEALLGAYSPVVRCSYAARAAWSYSVNIVSSPVRRLIQRFSGAGIAAHWVLP